MRKMTNSDLDIPSEQTDEVFQYLQHEDNLFTERVNIFVVVETIFLTGYIFAWSFFDGHATLMPLVMIFGIGGIVYTVLWLYIFHCHRVYTINVLKKNLNEHPDFQWYAKLRIRRNREHISVNRVMGQFTTLIFLAMWICLLLVTVWNFLA